MTLPVIIHPDVIRFFNDSSQTDFGNRVWKCIDKLKKRQFDGGLRVKKLQGTTKRVWEARVTQAVRLIFTYTKSIQPDTGEPQVYLTIQDLCLDHDDVSRQAEARPRTPDHQWLDAEEIETVGSLETERTSLTPDEQSAIDQAEAEELQISEEVVDELVGNIQWRVVESESEWQQAITNQDVDLPLKLTAEEYELVNHYGDLLLSGNAGTGKTTVGLYRLLKSLENLPEGKRLYVAYNPVLVKEAKQQFNRLVGAKISEVESLFEFKTIRELCLDILEEAGETYFEANEVTYQAFHQLYRRAERKKYPPALVWDEIRSIIKGAYLETNRKLLSKQDYEKLGKKRSSSISKKEERKLIYQLADWYQKQLDKDQRFDEIDLARTVLKYIKQGKGNSYQLIICDEVQDLTELQLYLLMKLLSPHGQIFFAGDLNQMISPSGFRWEDLKANFFKGTRQAEEKTLYFNFRSVGLLTQLANQVLKIKSRLLNERVEQSNQAVNSYGEWARLISASSSELQPTLEQLNPEDAILVRTEADKKKISKKFQSSFVFTIEEAKGLEFDTVFLVEFFQVNSDLWQKVLEGKGTLKDKEKPALRRELNLLYVAITRTRRILNIWETQLSSLWTQEEVDSFTEQIKPESVREVRIEPTAEMWKERGLYYLEAKFYRQAIDCFKFSGDFQLQRQSEAKLFLQEGKESEAIKIFVELGNHEEAAQLFEKPKQWEKAAEQYDLAGMQEKAAECRAKISGKKAENKKLKETDAVLGGQTTPIGGFEGLKQRLKNSNQQERVIALQQAFQYGDEGLKLVAEATLEDKLELAQSDQTPLEILQQLARDEDRLVRLGVASNPNTPLELLQQLARDEDWRVREKVAENPKTPLEVLQQLARDEYGSVRSKVASNPNTPPKILQQLARDENGIVKRVTSNPNTPTEKLQQLAQDEDEEVRRGVASNPNTPPKALQQLARDEDEVVRRGVASNPNTPPKALQQLARDEDWRMRRGVASNPNTPLELLQLLARDEYAEVRQEVASNPNTPLELIQELARDKSFFVRSKVASNPNLPLEFFQPLARDKHPWVRSEVALNPNTPLELLQKLARDKDSMVRDEVTSNPNTPLELVQQLALDEDEEVRSIANESQNRKKQEKADQSDRKETDYSNLGLEDKLKLAKADDTPPKGLQQLAQDKRRRVRRAAIESLVKAASDPNTSPTFLQQLAQDKRWKVRRAAIESLVKAASDPNTSLAFLQQLAQDKRWRVCRAAIESLVKVASDPNTSLAFLQQLAQDEDEEVREGVASNPNTPLGLLQLLARDEDLYVRSEVASNPNTPLELLQLLARDEDWRMRRGVASNPNTPLELLQLLARDEDEDVRSKVASNPNTPLELLQQLAQDEDEEVREEVASNPNTPPKALQQLARDEYWMVRRNVAYNPNTPPEILQQLTQDKYWPVRSKVASNPNTPLELLQQLAQDEDEEVRRAANKSLKRRRT